MAAWVAMGDDLVMRLNALADARHDDLDVAAEGAQRIISVTLQLMEAQQAMTNIFGAWYAWRDDPTNASLSAVEQAISDAGEMIPPSASLGEPE